MTPFEIISGASPVSIEAHLTDDSSLVYPLALGTIKEATFKGYASQVCQLSAQAVGLYGFGYCNASALFTNDTGDLFIRATAIYLVAQTEPRTLLWLLELAGSTYNVLPLGPFSIPLELMAFVKPIRG